MTILKEDEVLASLVKKEQNKQSDIDSCQKRSTCNATNKYQQTQNSLNNSEQKKTKVHDDSSQRRSTSNSNKRDHDSQSSKKTNTRDTEIAKKN